MVTAHELLRQGKRRELWQMCCGFLSLSIDDFMSVQERLLMKQIEQLGASPLGKKLLHGARPATVEEFRQAVPLTTYADYCPELLEKQEGTLPEKPLLWAHTAGRSGEYPCKWVPITSSYACELSKVLYGVGILSGASRWGDTSHLPRKINILYSVAPSPYISGIFADVLRMQSPLNYLPGLEESRGMSFEERIRLGFKQAISQGFDYFFGLSLVLVNVSEKITESSNKTSLRPYLKSPRALWRLGKGKLRSRLAGRPMLPRDLWKIRGIMGSGTDSFVYKDRIKEAWGRSPLDLYACTEGGVIATQTWDYEGMTFVPNLNFLEFIPEDEQLKNQFDRSYQPKTLLLNEVRPGENYEIVITSFHGGAVARYRIGDMVRITALRNEKLGIDIPQMAFERRVDDFIDFYVINFTERNIWEAIEHSGVAYEDWIAYKDAENLTLNIGIELKNDSRADAAGVAASIYNRLTLPDDNKSAEVTRANDLTDVADFRVKVDLLPRGTFAGYIEKRRAEGADLAHLKPRHVNPSEKVISMLTEETEGTIIVTRSAVKSEEKPDEDNVRVIVL
jgi:hypothetical protein